MKREEEKSYAGLFLFLSFILVLTMAWAVWDEAIGKRPWKMYQTRFYELEREKARGEYGETTVKLKSRRPSLQAYQVRFEDINEADRCMSCHVGINRKESISGEQPYASHSRRDVYLGNHPPEKFGCVLCHEGQGRATISPEKAHGEVEYWLKPMHRGKVAQSSCTKCHDKGEELAGGEDIAKGIALFKELGCFGCHETKGFGEDLNSMIGPDLTEIGSKVNPGWLLDWLKNPKHFRPSTRMPDFRLEEEDAMAITSYLWQNSEGFDPGDPQAFDDETIDEGAYLYESIGCLACHSELEEDGRIHGPNLSRIGDKSSYEYLVSWLLAPKTHQPKTSMPDMKLDEEDAKYVASFLMSLKGEEVYEDLRNSEWLNDKETAKKGEELVGQYGCFGCHKIAGVEGMSKIGVELDEVGSKHIHLFDFGLLEKEILEGVGLHNAHENISKARRAWFTEKLSDPRQFDEGRYKRPKDRLKMPDFGLSEEEIESLSILLTGMREDELPENYIAELTDEKKYLIEGKRVIDKYNCMGCHQFTIDTLYLKDGTEVKGMVKLEEEESLFFQLWVDNEGLGKKAGDTVQVANEEIERRVASQGGDISSFIIDYHVEVEGSFPEEATVFTPPVLYEEGKKVQFPWLFKFLKKPATLRPWLEVRMPTFNFHDNEIKSIVRYFAEMDSAQYPFEFFRETDRDYIVVKEEKIPGYLKKARNLFESNDVNCGSCHVRGDSTPEGAPSDWAPDLSLSSIRLKPKWIERWLMDPQLIQPGTKMPGFFREGVFQNIFPGSPKVQIEAIKDLLMNFPEEMTKQKKNKTL